MGSTRHTVNTTIWEKFLGSLCPLFSAYHGASFSASHYFIIFFLDEGHGPACNSMGVRNSASLRDISIREDETSWGTLADVLIDIFRNYHHKYPLSNPAQSSTLPLTTRYYGYDKISS